MSTNTFVNTENSATVKGKSFVHFLTIVDYFAIMHFYITFIFVILLHIKIYSQTVVTNKF